MIASSKHIINTGSLAKFCSGILLLSSTLLALIVTAQHIYYAVMPDDWFIEYYQTYPSKFDQSQYESIHMRSERFVRKGHWVDYHDRLFCNRYDKPNVFSYYGSQQISRPIPETNYIPDIAWEYTKKKPKNRICYIESTATYRAGYLEILWPVVEVRSGKFKL